MTDEVTARRRTRRQVVEWDENRKPPKPILPDLPTGTDTAGQCSWLTCVLHLDARHPVTGGIHHGHSGGRGHVELTRLDAESLFFEPASVMTTGAKLAEELVWQLLPADGDPYPWSNAQAVRIARVAHWLCASSSGLTDDQETVLIVSTLLDVSGETVGYTYGTSAQRAEAAQRLHPEENNHGRPTLTHYLVDQDTEELVVRVSDLGRIARSIVGGSIAHGWLDARMERLGWVRRELQGYVGNDRAQASAHKRIGIYRGTLPDPSPDQVDPLREGDDALNT